jgi:hypothetical protein
MAQINIPGKGQMDAAAETPDDEKSVVLPTSGSVKKQADDIRHIETVGDAYQFKAKAAALAFNEELVDVIVHESTDPNAEPIVQTAVNGVNQFFIRGQVQSVKRKFVEVLARAKTTSIATREARDYDGAQTTRITRATALTYPFSIVNDPNKKGAAWLKSVLAQG